MKKFLSILSICILICFICGCDTTPPAEENIPASLLQKEVTPWDQIVQNNEIRIGVPTTESTFDNQLIDAFAKESQLTVTKVPLAWKDEMADAIQDGTVDMLWGQIPATAESSTLFRLSNPYFHSTVAYISNVEDLQPERDTPVGVLENSAEAFMATGFFETVITYRTEDELFQSLLNKNVATILYNKALFEQRQPSKQPLHIIQEVPCDFVVAFEHNNTSVATEVEKIIAKIKADGTASQICTQWYPQDFITK